MLVVVGHRGSWIYQDFFIVLWPSDSESARCFGLKLSDIKLLTILSTISRCSDFYSPISGVRNFYTILEYNLLKVTGLVNK